MYLVFTSRLQKRPLHVVSLGASGTGKTYLQEKVAALVPEQEKVELTSSSENAFYYFGEGDLSHKLVLIEDMEGIGHMLYPIRELQSKSRISKTVPLKDSKGNLKTVRVEVEGPICLAGTTTKERIYQDNADRCLLVYLDNSPGQQDRIMEYQRKLSAGKTDTGEEETIKEQFKDIQSILRPIKTVNPYAEQLKVPDAVLKPLRTNAHYLAFIEAITFYHQYQRPIKADREGTPYIETTLEDIRWANRLLEGVLLAKSDELSGACRKFLENLKSWLQKENRQSFYAKELRAAFRISPDNLKYYLRQLHAYGHIKITGGNRYRKGFEYEIEDIGEYEKLKHNVGHTLDKLLQEASG
jgi:DNA primase